MQFLLHGPVEPQIVTKNVLEWRSLKNNIARYRRLARGEKE